MTDPWADVREHLDGEHFMGHGPLLMAADARRILADADALLAVAREYQANGYHPKDEYPCRHGMTHWVGDRCAFESHALAALPEHLR